jgi:hypothetical protein
VDFDLTQDQREIQALTRDFARGGDRAECVRLGSRPPLSA